jgi:GxxExxY protein
MTNHDLSYEIRGAAMEVYNTLGPGLLESVYHQAMIVELQDRGLNVKSEVPIQVNYKGKNIDCNLRLDLIVEDQVIVELKSVEELLPVHYKQLKTYLRLLNKELGWLINFGEYDFNEGMRAVKNKSNDQ